MFAATKSGIGATTAPATTDPYFNNTVLLLNDTGTNGAQNNTFIDSSTNNFTITRNGNTTQGSLNPYEPTGYWGGYFDGSGYLVNSSSSSSLGMGTSDFTMEAWLYYQGNAGGYNFAPVFTLRTNTTGTLSSGDTDGVYFDAMFQSVGIKISGTTTNIGSGAALTANTWTHLAVTRQSGTVKLFVNGVQSGSSVSLSGNMLANYIQIGCDGFGTIKGILVGYISNLRFVKGTAVYTSNFTVPTSPLTTITNTSLLCLQDNRFKDNSSNNFTFSVVGTNKVTGFNPFAPTASYTTSAYGGSIYFDGTGDYVYVATSNSSFNYGTGNFTIEMWVYPLAGPVSTYNPTFFTNRGNGNWNDDNAGIRIHHQNTIIGGSSFTQINYSTAIKNNVWSHVAFVRNGTTVTVYINGSSVGSATFSAQAGSDTAQPAFSTSDQIGTGGREYINGYISNARIVKGTAVYTSNFTPPTAPVTAISGTSLLLNTTNAGIYDATTLNDMETVGDAKVSTTQAKWGASSMAFDGTGDWLLFPHNQDLMLGTGNFTVEGWVYLSATGAARGIVGKGTSTTGWLLSTNSSNNVVFTYGSSTITSTGTLSGSTWYHIAVVRQGTGTNQTKIYINGTNDGTGTVSTDFNQTNAMYVGADRTAGSAFNGYIEDLRITKGVARYTSNFTAPTAAFPTR